MNPTHRIKTGPLHGRKAEKIATHPRTGKALLETRGGRLSYEPLYNLSTLHGTAPPIPDPADAQDPPDPWEPADIEDDDDD